MSEKKDIKNDDNEKKDKKGKHYESLFFILILVSTIVFTKIMAC